MDAYTILACVLVGALVFLIMCLGVAIIITCVDIIRNNDKEETENDAYAEAQIAEGN